MESFHQWVYNQWHINNKLFDNVTRKKPKITSPVKIYLLHCIFSDLNILWQGHEKIIAGTWQRKYKILLVVILIMSEINKTTN